MPRASILRPSRRTPIVGMATPSVQPDGMERRYRLTVTETTRPRDGFVAPPKGGVPDACGYSAARVALFGVSV